MRPKIQKCARRRNDPLDKGARRAGENPKKWRFFRKNDVFFDFWSIFGTFLPLLGLKSDPKQAQNALRSPKSAGNPGFPGKSREIRDFLGFPGFPGKSGAQPIDNRKVLIVLVGWSPGDVHELVLPGFPLVS